MANIIAILFLFVNIATVLCSNDTHPCGEWEPYNDEKCFHIYDHMVTNTEAQTICAKAGANLGIIRTEEEQFLIKRLINRIEIVDNVWIGVRQVYGLNNTISFEWIDGTDLRYNDWANGRPLNRTDYDCAVMSLDSVRKMRNNLENFGKWVDVNCLKKNVVLCEKVQPWSYSKIHKVLVETRRDNSNLNKELEILKANPVPIGFIYVELLGQPYPKTLWPNTNWEHISPQYAGLFFRAEGEGSAAFGEIQNDLTRRLVWSSVAVVPGGYTHGPLEIGTADGSPLYTGTHVNWDHTNYGIQMHLTTDEVRPRNQAVRIWKRVE